MVTAPGSGCQSRICRLDRALAWTMREGRRERTNPIMHKADTCCHATQILSREGRRAYATARAQDAFRRLPQKLVRACQGEEGFPIMTTAATAEYNPKHGAHVDDTHLRTTDFGGRRYGADMGTREIVRSEGKYARDLRWRARGCLRGRNLGDGRAFEYLGSHQISQIQTEISTYHRRQAPHPLRSPARDPLQLGLTSAEGKV